MDILSLYIDTVEQLVRLLSRHFRSVRFGPLELELRRKTEREFDVTFAKIEKARTNMAEAVTALDDLRDQYTTEQDRLTKLLAEVKEKRAEYATATSDLVKTRELLQRDQDSLRRILGINDRRSKIVGFISGVLASLVATALWFLLPKLWQAFPKWWAFFKSLFS